MSRTKKIILDVGTFGGSIYTVKIVNAVTKFVLFRFLGPFQIGIWSLLMMIMDWVRYVDFGVGLSLIQRIPRFIAEGRKADMERVQNLSFSFTFFSAGILAILILAAAFLLRPALNPIFFWCLILLAGLVFVQRVTQIFFYVLSGHQQFQMVGKVHVFSSISVLIFTLYFAAIWGLVGWMTVLLANACLWLFFISGRSAPLRLVPPFKAEILSLMKGGISLLALEATSTGFRSIDRIVISQFLGIHSLGLYSAALTASAAIYMLSHTLKTVILPHFEQDFVRKNSTANMQPLLTKSLLALAYALPMLIAAIWLTIPWLIHYGLPDFAPAVGTVKMLTLGSFFLGLTQPLNIFILTIRKQFSLFAGAVTLMILLASLEVLYLGQGGKIEGVAVLSSLAFFTFFSWNFFTVFRYFHRPRVFAVLYAKIVLIFAYVGSLLFLTDWLRFLQDQKGFIDQCLLVALGLIPLFFAMNRDIAFFNNLKNLMTHKKHVGAATSEVRWSRT